MGAAAGVVVYADVHRAVVERERVGRHYHMETEGEWTEEYEMQQKTDG
jgi:hypothetical protein